MYLHSQKTLEVRQLKVYNNHLAIYLNRKQLTDILTSLNHFKSMSSPVTFVKKSFKEYTVKHDYFNVEKQNAIPKKR